MVQIVFNPKEKQQEIKHEAKEEKQDLQQYDNARKCGITFKKENLSLTDSSALKDFQRLAVDANISINEINIAEYSGKYNAFKTENDLKRFFNEVVLINFDGNQDNKDSVVRYLLKAFHQGGFLNPVDTPLMVAFSALPIGATKDFYLTIQSTGSGIIIHENVFYNELQAPPGSAWHNLANPQTFVVPPDQGQAYVLRKSGTLIVDFSRDPTDPSFRSTDEELEFGNSQVETMMTGPNFAAEIAFNTQETALRKANREAWNVLTDAIKTKLKTDGLGPEAIKTKIAEVQKVLDLTTHIERDNVLTLRENLASLGHLFLDVQPKGLGQKGINKVFGNPRESLKTLLGAKGFGESFNGPINQFLMAQREFIANKLAYENASQQRDALLKFQTKMQDEYPGCTFEVLHLGRHEVCTDSDKSWGFKPDTGLHALGETPSKQSIFDLEAMQSLKTQEVFYLQQMQMVGKVELMMSNVQRAHETAKYTLRHNVADKVVVSSLLGEKQHRIARVSSSRALKRPSEVAATFGTRAIALNDELLGEEKEAAYAQRVTKAFRLISSPILPSEVESKEETNIAETSLPKLRTVVGHGHALRDILGFGALSCTAAADRSHTLPKKLEKLDFGSHYTLYVVRNPDRNSSLRAIEYAGTFDRFGQVQDLRRTLEERLSLMENMISSRSHADGKKLDDLEMVEYLYKYCLLQPDPTKVTAVLQTHGKLMLVGFKHFKTVLEFNEFQDENNWNQGKRIIAQLIEVERANIAELKSNPPAMKQLQYAFQPQRLDNKLALLDDLSRKLRGNVEIYELENLRVRAKEELPLSIEGELVELTYSLYMNTPEAVYKPLFDKAYEAELAEMRLERQASLDELVERGSSMSSSSKVHFWSEPQPPVAEEEGPVVIHGRRPSSSDSDES